MTPHSKHLYLIALVPSREILQDVQQIKEEIKARFSASHALKLPGHITLQRPFWVKEEKQTILKKNLDEFSKKQPSFTIYLDGFGSFPPRVIFVKTSCSDNIIQLQSELQIALPIELFAHTSQRQAEIHPHLTVATRDLQENIFPQAWKEFKDREYRATFIAQDLILFKHTGKVWAQEAVFQFLD